MVAGGVSSGEGGSGLVVTARAVLVVGVGTGEGLGWCLD